MNIKERARLIVSKGITIKALALMSNINIHTLYSFMSNKNTKLSYENIMKLSNTLDRLEEDFLNDD